MDKNESIKFLVESGLLFEINRTIFHPLGLSIVFKANKNGFEFVGIKTSGPEINFSNDMLEKGTEKYRKYMEKEGNEKIAERFEKLGYVIQEFFHKDIIVKNPIECRRELFESEN